MRALPTRRDIIRTGLATAAAASLPGCASSDRIDDEIRAGYIDAHTHVWSDDLARYPLGSWAKPADMKPPTFTANEFLAIARPHGVTRAVLIQHAPLHGYDNSYILDCAREHPGLFSVVAMINERTPGLRKRLSNLRDAGARGIRIGPTKHADRTLNPDPPNWLKADGMRALWKHAADLKVAICPLIGPGFLASLDPMCEANPETVVVIDHFAHIDMTKPETVTALTRLTRHRNVHVKVSGFYKFADKRAPYGDLTPMVRRMIDAFGPSRLMWASDCPYQLNNGNNYADAIALIRDEIDSLSVGDRTAILRDTAAKVFF